MPALPRAPRVEPSPWLQRIGLIVVVALALGVRLYGLGDEDYWLDELHSLANSAGRRAEFESLPHGVILDSFPRATELTPESTWPAVWRGMEADSHPPTYFLLLLSWRRILGDDEFAVRLLPVACSVLSILPVALILRVYGRPRDAWWVAAVLALAFSHVHIAQENRPYALGLFLVSISYWAFARIDVGWGGMDTRRRVLWLSLCGGAAYLATMTHYFTVLALLGQALMMLRHARGRLRRAWIVCVALAAAVFLLTWGRQLYGQWEFITNQPWLLERRPDHALRTLLRLADLPVRLLIAHERFQFNYLFSIVGVMLLAGGLLGLRHSKDRAAHLFAAWYIVPVAILAIVDWTTGRQLLAHVRYSSIATPGLVGLLVLATARLQRPLRWTARASFALVIALTLTLPTQVNPKSRRAARLIAEQVQPGDLLVYDAIDWPTFWAARLYHLVSYYLSDSVSAGGPSFVLLREKANPSLRDAMADYRRILVVSPRIEGDPNPLPGRCVLVNKTGYVRGVGFVYVFKRLNRKD